MPRPRKSERPLKAQMGQFMTPTSLSQRLVGELDLRPTSRVLEPSFGDGSFLLSLISTFDVMLKGDYPDDKERLAHILMERIWGVELDPNMYASAMRAVEQKFGPLPDVLNLVLSDFFRWAEQADLQFDLVVGNPPFGGTLDPLLEDALDRRYGRYQGYKIKKETYAFFIVAALEQLNESGTLPFICSDTFLTIPTMAGLRRLLCSEGKVQLSALSSFSEETNYPMVVLTWSRSELPSLTVNNTSVPLDLVESIPSYSFAVTADTARYFAGPSIGSVMVCTSGMTTGNNELFVRKVESIKDADGKLSESILEGYSFTFFDDPINLDKELSRARLGKLGAKKREEIRAAMDAAKTRRNVSIVPLTSPEHVALPHPSYRPYNVMSSGVVVFAPPKKMIFWKDEGDAVLTFKKNGNWYLHGVGGRGYFGREGITWNLIASRLEARYLPAGYVLDSGAPCAFPLPGVSDDEIYFVLGWLLTDTANALLKGVLNHTRNIQGKDIERLPYPWWVNAADKAECVALSRSIVSDAQAGEHFSLGSPRVSDLTKKYDFPK